MTGNVMQFATFARTYWMVRMYIITCFVWHLYYHPIGSKQVDLTEKNIINNLSRKFKEMNVWSMFIKISPDLRKL